MMGRQAAAVAQLENHNEIAPRDLAPAVLFDDVPLESIADLLSACPLRTLAADEVLIQPAEPNDSLYVLLSGRLRVHLGGPNAEADIVLEPGETAGELSVLDRRPASALVLADQPSRVLVIRREIAWGRIDASHTIARNLLAILSQRQRHSNALIADSRQAQRDYKRQAMTDELTGLHNRRWFDEMLPRLAKRNALVGRPLSLIMADVDHLARYNEEFGVEAGDHALYAVAQTIMSAVRPTDLLVRYRGGQFAILLPDAELAGARTAAERVRRIVGETVVELPDQSILPPTTLSLGIAQMKTGEAPGALVSSALAALTRAKARGGNRTAADE